MGSAFAFWRNDDVRGVVRSWRRGGLRLALRVATDQFADSVSERVLRLDTRGHIPIGELTADAAHGVDYLPSSIRAFHRVMRGLDVTPDDVFVDFGSGKGRVLVLAARYPFRRIVGIEISPLLCEAARANLERCLAPGDRRRVEIVAGSAGDVPVPRDATVLYFFNPFRGPVLKRVLDDVHASLRENPRRLTIVFNNANNLAPFERDCPWLRRIAVVPAEYDWVVFEGTAGL